MSEQAPGGLGGEAATPPAADLERIIGKNQAELDEILRQKRFYDFQLGRVFLDEPNSEDEIKDIKENINTCLGAFGLTGDALVEAFNDESRDPYDWHPVRRAEIQAAVNAGKSVGELYFDGAWMSLDIEGDTSGYVTAGAIEFQVSGNRTLTIFASGDFWTEHTYKHPVTGQPFSLSEEEQFELEDELKVDLELLDSEVGFCLEFEGRIEQN